MTAHVTIINALETTLEADAQKRAQGEYYIREVTCIQS